MGKFKATAEVTVKYDATILPAMAEHDYVKEAVIREISARVDSDVRGLSIDIDYDHENKEIPEALKAPLQGLWAPAESSEQIDGRAMHAADRGCHSTGVQAR